MTSQPSMGDSMEHIPGGAPHGGTWIQHESGLVEISVFETGVPPHFRLYFFDSNEQPRPPIANSAVAIETVRPDGTIQVFEFANGPGYLRSASDIPEPHEFRLRLTLHQGAEARTYETRF